MTTLPTPAPIDVTDDDDELTGFRRQLEEQLREREAFIADLDPRAAPHIDLVAWSSTQSALQVVAQINAALLRIDAGTFGTCSRCAGPIAPARLEIIPYADTCVPCHTDGTS
ncbi:TraR/DksA family transcriptional regulator [Herbiconiux ginsengi]|uniref:Transcriptional regulator, TraR/DksA family n=1 Tax=Herbiconiux ginsengi TaxID=381665 RepID=A0A1H3U4G9_9MICO|nr:TraR/DksA C4-type zinc finger protein [Herbiconiux ginsengi]SDZ56409.1 transcriptional regulator, TraR/DksA family [Herbiconiux ginsengi]